MKTEKTLIYDSNASGHLPDFIEYILYYFAKPENRSSNNFHILLNKKILNELNNNNISLTDTSLTTNSIDEVWQSKFENSKNLINRSLIEKKYLENYCQKHKIDKIVFLQIDAYQFIIGLWQFTKFKTIKISGIFLQPYIQIPKAGSAFNILNRLRKKAQFKFTLLNGNLTKLFILNDPIAVQNLNNVFKRKQIFKFVPDPIKIRRFNLIDIREKYQIPKNKNILLFIGGVQKRKNIINILNSIHLLSYTEKKKICFLILGKCFDIDLLNETLFEINQIKDVQIIFNNYFVDNNEFESAIQESSILFTIYSDFYCSSGIIGNGAKHNSFIIGTKNGVIGNYIKNYNLGLTVDPNNINEISATISEGLANENWKGNNSEFIKIHNYEIFVETILEIKQ